MPSFTIQKTINHGYGLTQDENGKTILVEGALPGETVTCKIVSDKKQYSTAKIKNITLAHPERMIPSCPYIKECGGCNLQHSSYLLQSELKTEIIKDILQRSSQTAVNGAIEKIKPCIKSKAQFHYRQRIRLHISNLSEVGFSKKKSNEIVAIKECLLAHEQINSALKQVIDDDNFTELCEKSNQLELLYNPHTDKVNFLFYLKRKPRPADNNCAKTLCCMHEEIEQILFKGDDFPLSAPISSNAEPTNLLQYSFQVDNRDFSLCWEIGGFCQVNLEQNVEMIKTVLSLAGLSKNDDVLDLYCGMGNFSIPLATVCNSVTGFEGQGAAIRAAKHNAVINKTNNTEFYKKPVHKACEQLIKDKRTFSCIVIDPPRQGAPDLAKQLAELTTDKIVYISCDPATLCRDLEALTDQDFMIEKIQPIDMFPQTHHIETIVLLKKSSNL